MDAVSHDVLLIVIVKAPGGLLGVSVTVIGGVGVVVFFEHPKNSIENKNVSKNRYFIAVFLANTTK